MLNGSSLAATPASDPDLWVPVTIRVAWELAMARVRVQPETLADVREHCLRSLSEDCKAPDAEALVPALVADYIARVRSQRYQRVRPPEELGIKPRADWVERIFDGLDRLSDEVARLHYGDGLPLAAVARQLRISEARVSASREGLRELARTVAGLGDAEDAEMAALEADRVLSHLASLPRPGCPGPLGLTTDAGLRHADRCPRCSRAVRLVRGGLLNPRELFRPSGPMVEDSQTEVLALLLHPDARRHKRAVDAATAGRGVPAGTDAWLIRGEHLPAVLAELRVLCEEGSPARHHLRGALVNGPGRWSRGVLLGPLGMAALEAARARPWADLGGIGELPAPLPEPPSAARWWMGAVAAAAATISLAAVSFMPQAHSPDTPIEASFNPTADGWRLRFDTAELATVDIVVIDGGELRSHRRDVRASKGAWASGDGDYQLEIPGDAAAVFASPAGLPGLEGWLLEAARAPDPLALLSERVQAAEPRADVALSPPRPHPIARSTAYTSDRP